MPEKRWLRSNNVKYGGNHVFLPIMGGMALEKRGKVVVILRLGQGHTNQSVGMGSKASLVQLSAKGGKKWERKKTMDPPGDFRKGVSHLGVSP